MLMGIVSAVQPPARDGRQFWLFVSESDGAEKGVLPVNKRMALIFITLSQLNLASQGPSLCRPVYPENQKYSPKILRKKVNECSRSGNP
jgi:hypothetical protein